MQSCLNNQVERKWLEYEKGYFPADFADSDS
ncbi:MAG: hypothetical protein RIS64_899 [Bacteroidota bacterium]|jgi:hypothetical protein